MQEWTKKDIKDVERLLEIPEEDLYDEDVTDLRELLRKAAALLTVGEVEEVDLPTECPHCGGKLRNYETWLHCSKCAKAWNTPKSYRGTP